MLPRSVAGNAIIYRPFKTERKDNAIDTALFLRDSDTNHYSNRAIHPLSLEEEAASLAIKQWLPLLRELPFPYAFLEKASYREVLVLLFQ